MEKSERRKKLEETMKGFNKGHKKTLLDFGTSAKESEVIPTGIKSFDDFIGGGTKKGTFSIIYGGFSVGKSTLVLQQIANAQKDGQICCYIDLEHSFDRERAKQLGVNLEDLILAEKCGNAEEALEIIRNLCKEKVVDYIAVDSVQALSPLNEQENKGKERQLVEKEIAELARTLSKFFRVVAPHVFNAKASVVMIGQIRIHGIGTFFTRAGLTGGEALKHWASQMVFIRGGQGADAPMNEQKRYFLDPDGKLRYKTEKIKVGFDSVLKLEKTKSSESATENSEIHLPFIYTDGFVNEFNPESQDIVIKGTEEEKEKIRKILVDKGIKLACHKLANDDQALTKLAEDYLKTDNQTITPEHDSTCPPLKPAPKKKRGRKKKLENLTIEEFADLKETGMLWEIYPKAPENFKDIKKEK